MGAARGNEDAPRVTMNGPKIDKITGQKSIFTVWAKNLYGALHTVMKTAVFGWRTFAPQNLCPPKFCPGEICPP